MDRMKPAENSPPEMPTGVLTRDSIANIKIEHGPKELLRKMLMTAVEETEKLGVTLSFAPMEELVKVNKENAGTWPPLVPIFDPQQAQFKPNEALCILGKNADGEVVLTQAVRFIDLIGRSVRTEAESLHLFYGEPDKQRRPGETVHVTAPELITGKTVYTGAHWVRPDFRGKGLPSITPRIARALAIGMWDVDYAFTFMAQSVYNRGVAERAGYPNAEEWVTMHNSPVWPNDTVKAYLLWNDRKGIEEDLEKFLSAPAVAASQRKS